VLLDSRARGRGLWDNREVENLLHERDVRPAGHARRLWTLVCLELWAQTFLDSPPATAGARSTEGRVYSARPA
jgi:hypothetical protein